MKIVKAAVLIAMLSSLICSTYVFAASKAEDAVEYREGILFALGWNVGPMGAMVQGKAPFDKKRFAFLAARTATLAPMALEGFTTDTKGIKSHALPALWENLDDFKQRMETLVTETAKLAEVAKGDDEGAMKQQFGVTVKVCKGCHEEYREEE